MAFSPDKLLIALRTYPAARVFWVAYSGGLDSSVLLHALAAQRAQLPGELRAVHVNHHLQSSADDWQRHCQAVCASLAVPLVCRDVRVIPQAGESLEALARDQRYGVLQDLLTEGDCLLLAQHQDDQLETFLLQLMRGAGVRGLAAMPASVPLGKGRLLRPLLDFSREDLLAWARARGLAWIEDPSNADTRFDRNYLRREILPRLKARWPAAGETAARSARHCAEAEDLLSELASEDAARFEVTETLPLAALRHVSEPRARNLLRHWIEQRGLPLPPAHKLAQVFGELLTAGEDRNPCIAWPGAELRRYRTRLYALAPLPEPSPEFQLRPGETRDLGAGLGQLRLVPARGEGLRADLGPPGGWQIKFRAGGEYCRPAGRDHGGPLKKWLQEYAVVPWMRQRLPLVYAGGTLAAVAGLFVCADYAATGAHMGLRIEWRGAPSLH